jgi:hypothetical protein
MSYVEEVLSQYDFQAVHLMQPMKSIERFVIEQVCKSMVYKVYQHILMAVS